MKWGEYSSDVQFILQRSDQQKTATDDTTKSSVDAKETIDASKKPKSTLTDLPKSTQKETTSNQNAAEQKVEFRKNDLVGIVKGVPHASPTAKSPPPDSPSSSLTTDCTESSMSTPPKSPSKMSPILEFNSADVRNSLDRKTNAFCEADASINESLQESYRNNNNNNIDSTSEIYKIGPPISSNGALAPPPYRNPPPPHTSPPLGHQTHFTNIFHKKTDSQSSANSINGNLYGKPAHFKEMSPPLNAGNIHNISHLQAIVNNATSDGELINDINLQKAQYRELIQLIQFQREKINIQQANITKVCMHPDCTFFI